MIRMNLVQNGVQRMDSRNDWFDKLYLQYSPQMVSISMRAGFTVEQAESITQEVFLRFLIEAPTAQGNHCSLRAYLLTTLRDLLADALRQRRGRDAFS